MKNLSDFKKRLVKGVLLKTEHEKLGSFGIRPIERVQSNAFTLLTDKNGKQVESWCYFPKATDFEVINSNTVKIFWGSGIHRESVLTYEFVSPETK